MNKTSKKKNIFILLLFVTFSTLLIIAFLHIVKWHNETKQTKKEIEKINENITIEEIKDNKNTEIIKNETPKKSNPYWDFIKMNLIDVNLENLKNINHETKGWIYVPGTKVNYPFVQTTNNEFYLNHSFNKNSNKAGWVFLDYRNNLEKTNKNTILYAHNQNNDTMFGTLKNVLSKKWLENKQNHVIKLSTEYENTLWQIFSIYHIPTTNDYIETNFNNDEEFLNFTEKLINRSFYNFNTTMNSLDQILTLSTCYNKKEKLVIHAKLIKKETK